MAKKKRRSRSVCLLEDCGTYSVAGLKVCRAHSSPAALQQEADRLRVLSPEGAWRVLRYPEVRRLFEVMARIDARAVDASSNGKLGAALSKLKEANDAIEGLAGRARRSDQVARCGRDGCPSRDRAQRADVVYCGYCGGLMPGRESDESAEAAVRASGQ